MYRQPNKKIMKTNVMPVTWLEKIGFTQQYILIDYDFVNYIIILTTYLILNLVKCYVSK